MRVTRRCGQLLGDALFVESIFDIAGCRRRRRFDALLESYGKKLWRPWCRSTICVLSSERPRVALEIIEAPGGFGKSAVLANLVAKPSVRVTPIIFAPRRFGVGDPARVFRQSSRAIHGACREGGGTRPDDVAWMQGRVMELAETLANGNHVVVVDGLDEVSWDAAAYMRELQKAGIRTLISMRWEGTGAPRAEARQRSCASRASRVTTSTRFSARWASAATMRSAGWSMKSRGSPALTSPNSTAQILFVARFIAEDVAGGQIDAAGLGNTSSGVEAYLDKWFSEVLDSAGSNSASIWAVRFLASAKGPLPAWDLEALVGSVSEQILRPTLSKTLAPVRRHLSESTSGFRLAHRRLAEFVRKRCDADADARRIIEHCMRWPTTRSAYALGYLVRHLLDNGDDQAIWDLLSRADDLGGNPWYLAHVEAVPIPAAGSAQSADPLQSYLADLDAIARRAEDLATSNRRQGAIVRLRAAALQSTFVSIAHRIPDELLELLAAEEGRLVAAVSLALRRTRSSDRAQILVQLAARIGGGEARGVIVHHAMQAIADCPARDRARFLAELAPALDRAAVVDAVALLKTPLDASGLLATNALAERMQDVEKSALLSMARAAAGAQPDPFNRAVWLAELAPEPDREQALDSVVTRLTAAAEELPHEVEPGEALVDVGIWLAGKRPSSWPGAFDLIQRLKPETRAGPLGSLAASGPNEATIPCINALLEIDPSDERSDALARATARLSDEKMVTLVQNVSWDFHELAWIAPVLCEPLRSQVAAAVFNYVSKLEPPGSAAEIGPLIGMVAPYLPASERGDALQLLLAFAAQTPPVSPHEDVARQALAMVRITAPDGEVVEPSKVRIGVNRAELLTKVAVADPARRRLHVNQALRAAIAVGDRRPMALLLAALASHADAKLREQLAADALRVALAITWEATLSETLWQVVPVLPSELRATAREALAQIETPERKAEVEYALLAQERPVPAALCDGLPAAIGRLDRTPLNAALTAVAVDIPDTTVSRIVEALAQQSGNPTEDTEATVGGVLRILVHAGRLSIDQAFAASKGKLEMPTIAELLRRATPPERQKLAESAFEAIKSLPEAPERVAALGALRPALVGSGISDVLGAQIETDLATIDISELALPRLANIVPVLPGEGRSAAVQALLDRRQAIHPNDWAALVAQLAPAAPTHLLSGLLSSLTPAGAADRMKALAPLAAEIARRGDDETAWLSWRQTLAMAERDPRWYFLEELREALPLAARVWGNEMVPVVHDVVQRVGTCFP